MKLTFSIYVSVDYLNNTPTLPKTGGTYDFTLHRSQRNS